MINIDWGTRVINVPQADLTLISGSLYELDVDVFRLALKDLEDDEAGMSFPATHRHNTQVELSGVTYARTVEIINGYTVTFEDGPYRVRMVGANHNIADVTNINQVSLLVQNSAGLISVAVGGGSPSDIATAVWDRAMASHLSAGSFGYGFSRLLGLSHENSFMDNTVFDGDNQMTSARLRVFDTAAHANAATNGGSETTGLIATYTISGTYASVGRVATYKMTL